LDVCVLKPADHNDSRPVGRPGGRANRDRVATGLFQRPGEPVNAILHTCRRARADDNVNGFGLQRLDKKTKGDRQRDRGNQVPGFHAVHKKPCRHIMAGMFDQFRRRRHGPKGYSSYGFIELT
jgi:hypothetical protein